MQLSCSARVAHRVARIVRVPPGRSLKLMNRGRESLYKCPAAHGGSARGLIPCPLDDGRRRPAPLDPYLAFGLAMCAIVLLSLAGTAYLAAMFNRRAKADLRDRLVPLAQMIDGEADLEEAAVSGRYRGQIAYARVVSAQGGMGRLFNVEIVDSAGGAPWEWSSLPEKNQPTPIRTFEGDPALEQRLSVDWTDLAQVVPDDTKQRFGFLYDPEAGMVRLSRAMHGRNDIPDPATFTRQLDALLALGDANRAAQAAAGPTPATGQRHVS